MLINFKYNGNQFQYRFNGSIIVNFFKDDTKGNKNGFSMFWVSQLHHQSLPTTHLAETKTETTFPAIKLGKKQLPTNFYP